LVGQKGVLPPS